MVEEHSGDMTSRDKKDARRIQADFEFEEVGVGGGRRGRRDRGDREREREPPPHQPPDPPPGPSMAIRPNGRRREAFGANLTTDMPNHNLSGPSHIPTPSPPPADVDPITAEYVTFFLFAQK
jgi:E3 ubiquitin-protein ligase ZNF598